MDPVALITGYSKELIPSAPGPTEIIYVTSLQGTIARETAITGAITQTSIIGRIGCSEMELTAQEILIYRGDNRTIPVTVTDDAGAVNLTGASIRFSVKKRKKDTDYIIKKSEADPAEINVTDAINGLFEIYIVPDDTQDLSITTYYFDIEITDSTGKTYTISMGTFKILEDVTRPDF